MLYNANLANPRTRGPGASLMLYYSTTMLLNHAITYISYSIYIYIYVHIVMYTGICIYACSAQANPRTRGPGA